MQRKFVTCYLPPVEEVANRRRTMASLATSYVAGRVASKRAEGLMAPLLEAVDDDGSTESESTFHSKEIDNEVMKLTPMQKLKSAAGKWNYSHDVVYVVSTVVTRSH